MKNSSTRSGTPLRRGAGFTLVEVMVASSVCVVALAALTAGYFQFRYFSMTANTVSEMSRNLPMASRLLARDLGLAG